MSDLTLRHELEVMDVKAAFHSALSKSKTFSVAEFSTWPLHELHASRPGYDGSNFEKDLPFRTEFVKRKCGVCRPLMAREITQDNDYKTKLLKLIPGDFVAAYLAIDQAIPEGEGRKWLLTGATGLLALLLPFTLRYLYQVQNCPQIFATLASLIVWIYSIGGPFVEWDMHSRAIASVLLTLWTMFLPLFQYHKPA